MDARKYGGPGAENVEYILTLLTEVLPGKNADDAVHVFSHVVYAARVARRDCAAAAATGAPEVMYRTLEGGTHPRWQSTLGPINTSGEG